MSHSPRSARKKQARSARDAASAARRRRTVQGALREHQKRHGEHIDSILSGVFRAAMKNKTMRLRLDRLFTDPHVLHLAAAQLSKANGRHVAGVDGVKFVDLTVARLDRLIARLHRDLVTRRYMPKRCKKKNILKPSGKTRTLRIPTVADGVIQHAAKLLLEPIAEADLIHNTFGGRPGRSVQMALETLREPLMYTATPLVFLKVDVRGFYDELRHDRIEELLRRRAHAPLLISAVMKQCTVWNKKKGVATGAPLSPLIANMYLSDIDHKYERRCRGYVRYLDDVCLVVPGGRHEAEAMLADLKKDLADIGLEIADEKTVIASVDDGIEFLGFDIYRVNAETVHIECSEKNFKKQKRRIDDAKKNGIEITSTEFKKLRAAVQAAVSNINVLDRDSAMRIAGHFQRTFKVEPLRMSEGRNSRREDEAEDDERPAVFQILSTSQTSLFSAMNNPSQTIATGTEEDTRGPENIGERSGVTDDRDAPKPRMNTGDNTASEPQDQTGEKTHGGDRDRNTIGKPGRGAVARERSASGLSCSPAAPDVLLGVREHGLDDYSRVDLEQMTDEAIGLHRQVVYAERKMLGEGIADRQFRQNRHRAERRAIRAALVARLKNEALADQRLNSDTRHAFLLSTERVFAEGFERSYDRIAQLNAHLEDIDDEMARRVERRGGRAARGVVHRTLRRHLPGYRSFEEDVIQENVIQDHLTLDVAEVDVETYWGQVLRDVPPSWRRLAIAVLMDGTKPAPPTTPSLGGLPGCASPPA